MSKLWVSEPRERTDRPGRWLVDVRRGTERHPRTFDSEAEARAYAELVRAEAERLIAVEAPKPKTLGPLVEAFLQKKSEEGLADTTLRVYGELLHGAVVPFFGAQQRASSVTEKDVERYKAARLKTGITSTTLFRELDRLRAVLEFAKELEVVERNVMDRVVMPKLIEQPKDWLRSNEIAPFLDACREPFCTIARFTLFTGLRRREVVYLQRGDVDLDAGVISVRNKPALGFRTKNGKDRSVPIVGELSAALSKHLGQLPGANTAWVFPLKDGQRRSERTRWFAVSTADAAKRAGIGRPLTFHDLRRTFGAMLIEAGVGIYQVSHLLGHSDVRITQKVYAPICGKYLADEARKLDRYLGPALEQEVPALPARLTPPGRPQGSRRRR